MRESAILLLCAVALAQGINEQSRACNCDPSEAQQICRSNYDNDEILIAHENCNQFYKCANGNPVAYFCPNNLLYDPYSQVCQWPDNVECGDRPIAESPVQEEDSGSDDVTPGNNCDPSEAPTICAADNSDGVLVAHENCNQFYQCSGSKPVALTCPPGLLYNPANEICDWSENVDCGDRVIPEPEEDDSTDVIDTTENDVTCNCDPEEAPAICAALGSENELIAHENCNQYYICNHGLPIAVSCFGDLLFNPYTRQCDWPRNVDCGDRLVPETECTGCNDNTNDASCDEDDVVPPPGDTEVVPPGTGNEPEDSDNVVVPTRPPGTCKCNPEEAPSICAAEDSDGVLVAHENCNQFYKCDHGKPVVQSCYGNLLYNPYTEQCDWPENVDCGDRVIQDPDDIISTPGGTNPGVTNPADTTPGNNCNPSEAPTICAADDSDGVLVAHENCNQFYKCSEGKPVALKCPPGLLYNPAKDQCDWPENVDCGDRVIPDPESSEIAPPGDDVVVPTRPPGTCNCNPGEAPSICAAEDSDGVLVAHENCNQFYKCDHGKPVVQSCYGNLLYNPYTEQCDWPENVDCGDRVIQDPDDIISTPGGTNPGVTNPADTTPGNNCNPSEAPTICAADDSDGVLVAHENCNQFYKCSEGKPVALKCPPGLLYNPAKDQCDWPENVDCGDRVIPDPESSEIAPPGDDVVVPTRPPGTCNCNPGEAPSICAAEDSDGVLVAHENCNQFYKCDHGKPVVQYCYGNLLYNPYTEQCDWPENVDCGDRVIPDPDNSVSTPGVTNPDVTNPGVTNPGVTNPADTTPGNNCNPSEAPTICAADDSDGVLVAHENCNQFYKCSEGKPVALKCPPGLLFNPAKDQCDWPENVDCGDRVIPDPESSEIAPPGDDVVVPTRPPGTCNCNPGEAPSICAAEDSDGVLVAHENCNQFYKCDHGKPVVQYCYGNLLYNPYTEQCDWPENVDCGDRVIPDPDNSVSTPGVTNPGVTNPGVTNPGVTNPGVTTPGVTNPGVTNPGVTTPGVTTPGVTNPGVTNPGVTNPGVTNPAETTPGNNCDPSEAPGICAADNSEGVLVAHENCNQFYMCSGGKPVALKCPLDLLFNPAKDQCDWPENVDCGDRVIPDPESSEIAPPGDDVVVPTRPPGTCNCNPGEAPSICAAEDSDGVLVAHENCNQFYKCDHGKPVVQYCYGNLLYNPYTEQCDWPENVDCGDRVIPDPDNSVSTPGVTNPGVTNPGVTTPGVTYPGVTNPGVTTPGVTNPGVTTPGVTNPGVTTPGVTTPGVTTPGVTNPGVTNPGVTNPAETTPGNNCDPSEAPGICAADNSEGVLVAHENCNQFYMCSGGKPVALKCPPGLLFNPAKDQCDWPENVDCGDRVIPDPESSEIAPPGDDVVVPTRPPGTCNCNPGEAPSICAAEDSDGVLVAHENCNQFYKCDHGKPVVQYCYGNLLYNPYTEQCDWPENVDCGDRVIPDPDNSVSTPGVTNPGVTTPGVTNPGVTTPGVTTPGVTNPGVTTPGVTTPGVTNPGVTNPGVTNPAETTPGNNCDPSEAPGICAADNSEGVLVAHENCNQFYMCSGGKPVALKCPPGLLFNPAKDQCDWPENVDCGDRVIPDPESSEIAPPGDDVVVPTRPPGTCNCNPGEAPSICAAEDSDGVLVAHENCNQFYKCDHGKPVVQYCYGNLLYNPYTEQCDWPENVDCGDRVIPDPDNSVSTPGVTNPGVTNPGVTNPGVTTPGVTTPGVTTPGVTTPGVTNPGVTTPGVTNPGVTNPGVTTPGVTNPGVTNPGVTNPTETTPGNNCDPSEAPGICAADNSEGVLVAHENCNQFYMCSGGKPVALKCPPGLLYNPAKDQCDWPENVDCGDRVIPDPESSEIAPPGDDVVVPTRPPGTCNCNPGEAPSICAAEDSDGVLVAHENCNQFYKCDHGKPVVQYCYGNLLYNPYTEQCDWPENVDCGDRVIPDPDNSVSTPGVTNPGVTNPGVTNPGVTNPGVTNPGVTNPPGNNCDPSEAPSICAADNSEGILVAHENCNQFYKCSEGTPAVYTCPPNLLYNPNKDQCDWPFNVDCGDRLIPNPEGSDSDEIPPPGDVIPPQPPVDSNEDCSGNNDENAPCNCDPDQAPSICAGVNTDGILIAHENCNQFYQCVNNRPVSIRCPANTLYNPVSQTCDWPFNVDCGDRIIPDLDDNVTESKENDSEEEEIVGPCNCNPAEAPAICAATGSSGVQIAHENCNQFYICDHYRPVVFTCNGLLLYNPYTQRCEWPETVECGDRVIPEPGSESDENDSNEENVIIPNDDPSQAPTICAGEGSEGVLVAHENCDQYYICSGGVPVSRPCNDGLFYNPNNQRCDWPSNVVCGDRIVPDDCACNPRNAPALCAKPGSDGKLIAHENCNQFYICAHSVPVPQSCPASLLYNPDKELCDWPRSVNCEARLLLFASLNKHSQTRQSLRN
ncbi:hypothetical protein PYW07_002882 [Mythimna separata]|uniref:Chitin-binding type-2 domain-containing protein n=1 Tax=Mythimna separata TaxID=271217 RepID=A0AAD7YGQ1_MYTSE|nr:hypothetical protein PYW07_002882 [Mythimna separata]